MSPKPDITFDCYYLNQARKLFVLSGPGSHPCQSTWDLMSAKWNWDRFSPTSSVFHCRCNSTVVLNTHISSGGWIISPLVASVQKHHLNPSTLTWHEQPFQRMNTEPMSNKYQSKKSSHLFILCALQCKIASIKKNPTTFTKCFYIIS